MRTILQSYCLLQTDPVRTVSKSHEYCVPKGRLKFIKLFIVNKMLKDTTGQWQ